MREGKNCLLSSIPATLDTSSIPGLSSELVAALEELKEKGEESDQSRAITGILLCGLIQAGWRRVWD